MVSGELVGRGGGGAEPDGAVRHHQQRGAQGEGAHDERDPGVRGPPYAGQVGGQRRPVAPGRPDHDGDQRRRGAELGQVGAERGAGDPQVQAVDQGQVEDDVEQVPAHRDVERGPGVLETAEDPGGGQHHQQRGDPEEGHPQVAAGLLGDLGAGAEQGDQRVGEQHAERRW